MSGRRRRGQQRDPQEDPLVDLARLFKSLPFPRKFSTLPPRVFTPPRPPRNSLLLTRRELPSHAQPPSPPQRRPR